MALKHQSVYRCGGGKTKEFVSDSFSLSVMDKAKSSAKNKSRKGGDFDESGEGWKGHAERLGEQT